VLFTVFNTVDAVDHARFRRELHHPPGPVGGRVHDTGAERTRRAFADATVRRTSPAPQPARTTCSAAQRAQDRHRDRACSAAAHKSGADTV